MTPADASFGSRSPIVIVGTGQAGFQTAASLRECGHAGEITLVGAEPHLPYYRPPLSKTYLEGSDAGETLSLRPDHFYEHHGLHLRAGDKAVAINRAGCELRLASGDRLNYGHLVLALGAEPRTLSVVGGDLSRVMTLRTIDDADELRRHLSKPSRLVIVGGGFIGMEIAASAATSGCQVTVVESMHQVMTRVVAPEIAAYVHKVHSGRGTSILTGRSAIGLHGSNGRVCAVELDDGTVLPADVVVIGIGVKPNTPLAEAAGLDIDNGIAVDDQLLTADARISAIGDCSSFPSVHAKRRVRLESVQNAVDQARYVATRLTGSSQKHYAAVPWFWTHQYDTTIQTAGIGGVDDERVVGGDSLSGKFSVLRFQNGALACVESVNSAADHMAARKLLSGGLPLPRVDEVTRPNFSLKQFAKGALADAGARA